jgi:hypothetical protein
MCGFSGDGKIALPWQPLPWLSCRPLFGGGAPLPVLGHLLDVVGVRGPTHSASNLIGGDRPLRRVQDHEHLQCRGEARHGEWCATAKKRANKRAKAKRSSHRC